METFVMDMNAWRISPPLDLLDLCGPA